MPHTSDYNYDLPDELIAQTPAERRDGSRLLVLGRESGAVQHRYFYEICEFLRPGDLLVINDSRVFPARLFGKTDAGTEVEVVLLEKRDGIWEALTRPGRRTRRGKIIRFSNNTTAEVVGETEDGNRLLRFDCADFDGFLRENGELPLPPYIKSKPDDSERYQTVYSKNEGSAASPTAGLHFTPELLERIKGCGVGISSVTLHVGLGTFRPVKTEDITGHKMHSELYSVSAECASAVNNTRAKGGRIIAVGTTSCRALESSAGSDGMIIPGTRRTDIFIYEGYRFKAIDALVTNFHLPRSTLLMLVSAFADRTRVLAAYEEAIAKKYRFFSFGDAMLII